MSSNPCPNCGGEVPASRGTTRRVWCSDRCRKAAARNGRPSEVIPDLPATGSVHEAVRLVVETLAYPDGDPRAVIASVALVLAAELDRAPSPQLARELRNYMFDLTLAPNEEAGKIDEIAARRASRRVEMLLGPQAARRTELS